MSKKSSYVIFRIIKDSYHFQQYDNNGEIRKNKFYFSTLQLIALLISVCLYFWFEFNISENLIAYLISALSIFAGFFLTLVLTVFDKFLNSFVLIDDDLKNEAKRVVLIKKKNYFKKFTILMSYAIVISIISIILMSCKISIKGLNENIINYTVLNFSEWDFTSVFKFFKLLLSAVFNVILLYILMDLVIIIFKGFGSLYVYYLDEIDKIKLEPPLSK